MKTVSKRNDVMATIKDVAKMAGVSPATVSRVINGSANVNEEKRKIIFEVIEKLDFKPSEVARSLIKKTSRTIGLLLPGIVNPFFSQVAEAVEKTASKYGYKTTLCISYGNLEKEKEYINSLQLANADGIVVISENEQLEDFLDYINIPIVALDRFSTVTKGDESKYSFVTVDNYLGGKMAAQHLINCGCRRIAHIRGPLNSIIATERMRGFQSVLNEKLMDCLILSSSYSFEDGLNASYRILREHPEIDGVFAGNDMIAISLIKAAYNEKKKIPDELQIVGYDNISFSKLVTPSLTTIAQPIDKSAQTAVDLLISKIQGKSTVNRKIVLPIKLIERETTIHR